VSRKTLFAAAALVLGTTGLTTGLTAGSAAQAATPSSSLRVVAPCTGGPGSIAVTARRSSTGGTTVATKISGVTNARWAGYSFVGTSELEDFSAARLVRAKGGVITDRKTSPKSWPRQAGALFFSRNGQVNCVVLARAAATRDVAGSMDRAVLVHRGQRFVRGYLDAARGSRWRVTVTLTTPTGTQHRAKRVTAGRGGVDTRLRGFRKVGGYTRVVLRATNLRNGRVVTLRMARNA